MAEKYAACSLTIMAIYPTRSPLKVAEAIKDIIKGKVVCEVGCCEGDLLIAFQKYAKKVIGIEKNKERFEKAKEKGLEVYYGEGQEVAIPEADVYYLWLTGREPQYILRNIKKGVIVAGIEGYPKEDLARFLPLQYNLIEVRHEEISDIPNIWATNNFLFRLAIWTKE